MTGGKANPAAGTRFELRVRDDLAANGYYVLRSPASAGPLDLVAVKPGQALMVQCKVNGRLDPVPWNALVDTAAKYACLAILAERGPLRGTIAYWRLTGHKTAGSRNPPREPFILDEAARPASDSSGLPALENAPEADLRLAFSAVPSLARYGGFVRAALAGIYAERRRSLTG